jgi:hypothetical protein
MPQTVPVPKTCIEKCESHMRRMQMYLEYVFAVQKIVPKLALGVPKKWLEKIGDDIEEVFI